MKQQRKFCFNIVATSLIALSGSLTLITQCNASDFELSGKINAEYRQFVDKGAQGQDKQQVSIAFQPQLYWKLTKAEQVLLLNLSTGMTAWTTIEPMQISESLST